MTSLISTLTEDINNLLEHFVDFFWGVGYFGPQIATVYVLYIVYQYSIIYCILFSILFIFSTWLNHKILKKIIYDSRPLNGIIFLASEKFRNKINGMPSGHTQQTAFALTIAYLFSKKNLYLSIGLLLLTSIQRYIFKNHTILQLIVGTVIGIGLGYISFNIMKYLEKNI
jgi:membrane-associated phospholipid phosphatase